MKVSTVLDHIDSGHMALPEFQRGYVWNREQVKGLMESLYRRHPVGGLLVWVTNAEGAQYRGDGDLAPGMVKLLLDGQQRMTSLYGLIRGKPPKFFDGNKDAFTGLYFHVGKEDFKFYSPVEMKDEPHWVDVTALMKLGYDGIEQVAEKFGGKFVGRLSKLLGIRDIDFHVEEVTGPDKTIEVVVDIFNKVNSGGTKLSGGDLALARICASWPDARDNMKAALAKWQQAGYWFNLDWLLRNMNAVVKGEAKFQHLHAITAVEAQEGLKRAEKALDKALNLVSGRLGLDHDQVLAARGALPLMAHYLDRRGVLDAKERDQLLFWYLQCAMFGRYSGSTESMLDKDLAAVADLDGALPRLVKQAELAQGGLLVYPDHFGGWSLGARFYPILYLLTRTGEAKDWGTGLPLKHGLLGKMNQLQVHHIFPKAQLYKRNFGRAEVNAVANFCFLTADTNLQISDQLPSVYFKRIEANHPGTLASQWIPEDPVLWKVENYLDFLEARKELLAEATNALLIELAHGLVTADGDAAVDPDEPSYEVAVPGGIDGAEEEQAINEVNTWVVNAGLPAGAFLHELVDAEAQKTVAVLDLAWPDGMQVGLSLPVALLLNEPEATLQAANAHGYRYFTSVADFKVYVEKEVLAREPDAVAELAEP